MCQGFLQKAVVSETVSKEAFQMGIPNVTVKYLKQQSLCALGIARTKYSKSSGGLAEPPSSRDTVPIGTNTWGSPLTLTY